MNTYAITYTYCETTAAGRDEVRPVHVEFLQERFEAGELLISGPVDSGAGALLVVAADSEAAALEMMDQDPFAKAGLISQRDIRRWDVFFGKDKL
ncbi:YciI family protein [Glutamicibacter sp. MNS18]|uniref:YciI family protein n=1 Tax=Glutamicibacter sp. MNS18 TaxID=2989817 RepID=UPI0022360CA4|nr:YciI family protein [Glutamicibacter sp. MNS18]MCW4464736.1 YciI family protein [Glutamicibacter sp. MNS18]